MFPIIDLRKSSLNVICLPKVPQLVSSRTWNNNPDMPHSTVSTLSWTQYVIEGLIYICMNVLFNSYFY